MPNYRRNFTPGGTYFFTVVTFDRQPWLCSDAGRRALREAIEHVRRNRPFAVDAFVLLPEHLHCIWTLPAGDSDFSTRWGLIKSRASRQIQATLPETAGSDSRKQRGERDLWQRRFWEHTIRDEADFVAHSNYVHYNPVKHGLVSSPSQWLFSTFHRFVRQGIYPKNWATGAEPTLPDGIGGE